MWVNIYNKLYNLDKYNMIQGDVTAHGKTYLSLVDTRGVEVRIQLGLDEIENIINKVNDVVFGDLELLKTARR